VLEWKEKGALALGRRESILRMIKAPGMSALDRRTIVRLGVVENKEPSPYKISVEMKNFDKN
jgi:hypothetical protein